MVSVYRAGSHNLPRYRAQLQNSIWLLSSLPCLVLFWYKNLIQFSFSILYTKITFRFWYTFDIPKVLFLDFSF